MGKGEQAAAKEQVWLVLQRDLTVWLRGVKGPAFLTAVLDLTNGASRCAEAGSSSSDSFRNALTLAAKKPVHEADPRTPDRIQVAAGLAQVVRAELPHLEQEAGFRPDTIVEEIVPEDGAEGVLDYLIAQMAGRQPPQEPLLAEDATFLYEQARRFMEAHPWTRWTSEDPLLLELKLGTQRMEGIATVLGHGYTQPAVILMPGRERMAEKAASRKELPIGTLMMQLEGAEIQPDLFLRARRYGWPMDAAVTPNFIGIREQGFAEVDRRESWPLALVLAGLVAHFERGDVSETRGLLDLPTGHRGRYRVRMAPKAASKTGGVQDAEMLGIKISMDLMPDNSEIQIGVMSPERLASLREEAEVRLPPTFPFPPGINPIPLIAMTPSDHDFRGVADRIKRAKPIGATVIERKSGPLLTIVGERAGFVISDHRPSAKVWKRNIQNSDGAHVLIVTDGIVNRQEPDPDRPGLGEIGRIYGLFECMLRGGFTRPIET